VVLALNLRGVPTIQESLAGFGQPVVILIAAVSVVCEGLITTGVAHRLGEAVMKAGGYDLNILAIRHRGEKLTTQLEDLAAAHPVHRWLPRGDPQIVFTFRHPDVQGAAELDVRPNIAGNYRIKFKAETLPLKDQGGRLP
jgi:hypothetical protein